MLEMTVRDIIPAVSGYLTELSEAINLRRSALKSADVSVESDIAEKLSAALTKTYEAYRDLERVENNAVKKTDTEEAAFYYKTTVLPKMDALRRAVDSMEVLCDRKHWPMPTYGELMFRI